MASPEGSDRRRHDHYTPPAMVTDAFPVFCDDCYMREYGRKHLKSEYTLIGDVSCGRCSRTVGHRVRKRSHHSVNLCSEQTGLHLWVSETCRQLTFLKSFRPDPLNPNFRGDVKLVGGDSLEVEAHRFILASRSPVFDRMFTSSTKRLPRHVPIKNTLSPVLRSMVNFCYTAEIRFTETATAEDVFRIADKYDICELRLKCLHELLHGITTQNLRQRFLFAGEFDLQDVKDASFQFFKTSVYTILPGQPLFSDVSLQFLGWVAT